MRKIRTGNISFYAKLSSNGDSIPGAAEIKVEPLWVFQFQLKDDNKDNSARFAIDDDLATCSQAESSTYGEKAWLEATFSKEYCVGKVVKICLKFELL